MTTMKPSTTEEYDARRLINWSELSRLVIKGDRNGIRMNKIPLKHQEKINKLIKAVEDWQEWAGINEREESSKKAWDKELKKSKTWKAKFTPTPGEDFIGKLEKPPSEAQK